jgi:hypothetical protein
MVPCGASHFQHVKHIVTQLLFLVCSLMQFCYNFFYHYPYESTRFTLPVFFADESIESKFV